LYAKLTDLITIKLDNNFGCNSGKLSIIALVLENKSINIFERLDLNDLLRELVTVM
jgi:hypothetical protein